MLLTLGTCTHWKVQWRPLKITLLSFATIKGHHFTRDIGKPQPACFCQLCLEQLAPWQGRISYCWMVMLSKVERESLNTVWSFNCVTEVDNWIGPLLHSRGRVRRRQAKANIKCVDKRAFNCMKKCWVLQLHNWCSAFSDIEQTVQVSTLAFLLVLGNRQSSELALPLYTPWLLRSELLCGSWGSLEALGKKTTSLGTSGECKK